MPATKPNRQQIHKFCDLAHSDRHLPELAAMLAGNPDLLTAARPGRDKETALGAAVHSHARKTIRFLLDQGLEPDVFTACALNDRAEVKARLDGDPDLITARAAHAHNMDLFDLAPTRAMTKFLLKSGYPLTVHLAAAKGLVDQVKSFVNAEPGLLEAKGREGEIPLFNAIWGGQDEAAFWLLDAGSDREAEAIGGRPLSFACTWGRSNVAKALLERGIDLSFISFGYRYSYLHLCSVYGKDGMGPLSPTAYEQEIQRIIKMLLDAGIDRTIKSGDGLTASQLAEKNGFSERAGSMA